MRRLNWLVLVWALVCSGCGDDAAAEEPESVALIREWISAWDREIAATCPCLVAMEAFPSELDCMQALGSGPTWAECVNATVEEADAAVSFVDARCMIEARSARAACLEEAACDPDATAVCLESVVGMDCPPIDNDLVVLVLQRCPDLGLLSR